jgi:hypothetical protein
MTSHFEAPTVPRPWWRVEIDASGAILSCKEVEIEGNAQKRVLYFQAADAKEAVQSAKEWYLDYRARRTKSSKKYADNAWAAGRCMTCGNKKEKDRQHLTKCRSCEQRCSQRRVAKKAGAPLLVKKHTPESAREAMKVAAKLQVRLPMILKKFDSMGPADFRAWLVAEIERRTREAAE